MAGQLARDRAIQAEQRQLDRCYRRLDQLRRQSAERLKAALAPAAGTAQAVSERDAHAASHRDRLARLDAVERDLCFGRLDLAGGERLHIGRIGLFDETDDHAQLLTDWRAPAARSYYTATAVSPQGVRRRRSIRSRGRRVVDVDDELLDAEPESDLVGEAALMAALAAHRTGRMSDMVATIQAEQDAVIRAPLEGVLVVQGGPGTGKTAVALHRAAYLLFTHRERLTRRGVLLVGPNTTFLRYISQVLPSLAETGVLARTPAELFPGVDAGAHEPAEVAALKGRPVMADVIAAAVRDRQEVPEGGLELVIDGELLRLERAEVAVIRERARAAGLPHHAARPVFARELVATLARRLADRIGHDPYGFDPLGEDDAPGTDNLLTDLDVGELADQLAAEPAVRQTVQRLWPKLTAQRLLADLWASPRRIAAAAPQLAEHERSLLLRPVTDLASGWTPADVPLLDEASELLGEDVAVARASAAASARERRDRVSYAQGVLDVARGSRSVDLDAGEASLQAGDLLDAERLAARQHETDTRTAAERAAADRTWTFGHVIVDEGQELSAMAWRVLMRRCPTRSMTVVGDLAQTSDPAGASSWRQVFEPSLGDRWRSAELTISYRTPSEVMQVAGALLARIDPTLAHPRAVRSSGHRPWTRSVDAGRLAEAVATVARAHIDHPDAGTLAVIVPGSLLAADAFVQDVTGSVPGLSASGPEPDLDSRTVILSVRQVKGLEFDSVLVVEPAAIVGESPRGLSDLYVALTRPTRRLGIVHSLPLPDALSMATLSDAAAPDG